jgi:hypothetical protein
MQYCLLIHYQGGPEIGLTEEDMAPARAAFARGKGWYTPE